MSKWQSRAARARSRVEGTRKIAFNKALSDLDRLRPGNHRSTVAHNLFISALMHAERLARGDAEYELVFFYAHGR